MAGVKGRSGRKLDTIWSDAIRKAVSDLEGGKKKINKLAETLVSQALQGDIQAMKEIGDRLEGKPVAPVDISGEIETHYVARLPDPITNVDEWQTKAQTLQ